MLTGIKQHMHRYTVNAADSPILLNDYLVYQETYLLRESRRNEGALLLAM